MQDHIKKGGSVMHKLAAKTRHSRGLIRNDLEKLKAILAMTAKDVSGETKRALYDTYETAKDKTVDLQDNVADYIGSKPYKALAIALFSGLAFGLAMRRKKHSRRYKE